MLKHVKNAVNPKLRCINACLYILFEHYYSTILPFLLYFASTLALYLIEDVIEAVCVCICVCVCVCVYIDMHYILLSERAIYIILPASQRLPATPTWSRGLASC